MLPYRFENPEVQEPATAPVYNTINNTAKRWRHTGTSALLALALAGSVGGGALGGIASSRWAGAKTSPVAAISPQPVGAAALPADVAGAVFAKVNPAVVQIVSSGDTDGEILPLGSGSGFVVDARGLILTNNHVVDTAASVRVRFSTGDEREATVLGTDRGNDLALLKVDLPVDVPVAQLGDSDEAQVGETAIAIGSPFGLDQTVTQGIISAVHRDWQPGGGRAHRNLIQTDAPINPGNSGGPLLNGRGEVIGINTMIESPVRGSVGVGFAVPINTAKRLFQQLEAGAHLEPVWLGIAGRELDAEMAAEQALSVDTGIMIASVSPGSPAAAANLRGAANPREATPRGGDIITAVDGKPVTNVRELTDQLTGHVPGDVVELTVVRDGEQRQVPVTLQAWPRETA